MNGCERMMTAARGGQPDRIPVWELIINRPVMEAIRPEMFSPENVEKYQWGSCGAFEMLADFIEAEDLDGITVFEDTKTEEIEEGVCRDDWGITWEVQADGIPYATGHPIETEADLAAWEPPDPDAEGRLESLKRAVERFKGEKAIVFLSHDAFEFSHYLRGMQNLLMDYVLNPDMATELARKVIRYKTRIMERAAELGADILCTGDDYAHRQGTIMSREHFEKFVLPYLQQSVNVAKSHDIPFMKHTDGNLWDILDLIIGTGIDILDPLEPIADMDMAKVKEPYGDQVALAGNVDCGQLLPFGSEQEVEDAVKETIAKGGPSGGLILASSNSIHPAVKPENYEAMVRTAREYGEYPLDAEMVETYRERDYMARYR